MPGVPPDGPPVADLRPDGSAMSPVMPFDAFRHFNDVDADARYQYLRAL